MLGASFYSIEKEYELNLVCTSVIKWFLSTDQTPKLKSNLILKLQDLKFKVFKSESMIIIRDFIIRDWSLICVWSHGSIEWSLKILKVINVIKVQKMKVKSNVYLCALL